MLDLVSPLQRENFYMSPEKMSGHMKSIGQNKKIDKIG